MIDIINKMNLLIGRINSLVWVIILMVMGALIEIAGIGLVCRWSRCSPSLNYWNKCLFETLLSFISLGQ